MHSANYANCDQTDQGDNPNRNDQINQSDQTDQTGQNDQGNQTDLGDQTGQTVHRIEYERGGASNMRN